MSGPICSYVGPIRVGLYSSYVGPIRVGLYISPWPMVCLKAHHYIEAGCIPQDRAQFRVLHTNPVLAHKYVFRGSQVHLQGPRPKRQGPNSWALQENPQIPNCHNTYFQQKGRGWWALQASPLNLPLIPVVDPGTLHVVCEGRAVGRKLCNSGFKVVLL